MRFSRRLIKVGDLKWCSEILEDGFENRPELKETLPHIWATLLFENAITMFVIYDEIGRRPVAFAAGAIVSDDFVEQVRQAGKPHLALAAIEVERGDLKRFILRPEEVRKVNHPERGVNLAILHYSEVVDGYRREELRVIRDTSLQAMLELQAGYALVEVLFEFYGEEDVTYAKLMGFNPRTDYLQYYCAMDIPRPQGKRRPFLVGLSTEEVEGNWGTALATLFSYSRPYLFFTTAQQSVLIRALLKYSDLDIANDLGISAWTVKEHWKTIFDRVLDTQDKWPTHLRILPERISLDQGRASGKPRTKLLQYLAQHPSELRPVDRRYFQEQASRSAG